jgi:glycosyltransferase involved in cell wall biosynthesis
MAYLYSRARMLVFPSLFEGLAFLWLSHGGGCPVVAADATSIPEVLGNAGLLFDPASPQAIADTLEKVWCDASLRQKLVALESSAPKSFSLHRAAQAHLAVFAEARNAYSYAHFWKRLDHAPLPPSLRRLALAWTQGKLGT